MLVTMPCPVHGLNEAVTWGMKAAEIVASYAGARGTGKAECESGHGRRKNKTLLHHYLLSKETPTSVLR